MSDSTAFAATLAVVLAAWAWVTRRHGPAAGLGVAVLVSALTPVWVRVEALGLPVDCRTAAAGVALLWLCLDRRGRIRSPIVWVDGFVAALVVWQMVSDSRADGVSAAAAVRAYGEWAFPYLAGRLAIRGPLDTAVIARWGAGALAVLSGLALLECFGGFNAYDAVYGPPDDPDFPRTASRYGLRRAMGPTEHPIFLGAVLLTLLPWAVPLWHGRRAAAAGVLVAGSAAMVATLSRAPVAVWAVAAMVLAAVRWRALRWPVAGVLAAGAVGVAFFAEPIALQLAKLTPESRNTTDVEINGRRYETSSATERIRVVQAWWPALVKAGPVGFGTTATKGFPPNVPGRPSNPRTLRLLQYVDNGYLLVGIRLGWVGAGLLAGMLLAAAASAVRLVDDRTLLGLPGALAAVLVAAVPLLLAVHLNYDFAFELISACGFAGALASADRAMRTGRPLA